MNPRKSFTEPPWCVKPSHDDSEVGLHVSRELSVGDRYRGSGEVMVYLRRGGAGPTWVAVNVAHMASATVDITLEQARQLRANLDYLIGWAETAEQQAGR